MPIQALRDRTNQAVVLRWPLHFDQQLGAVANEVDRLVQGGYPLTGETLVVPGTSIEAAQLCPGEVANAPRRTIGEDQPGVGRTD